MSYNLKCDLIWPGQCDLIWPGQYRVSTSSGTLNQAFSRSQLEKCKNVFIAPADVPEPVLSVRSANAAESIVGGQGHECCTCQQGCKDNRCKWKKKGLLCNSYCHKSSACKNKGWFVVQKKISFKKCFNISL